jgi:hypothetical protein
MDRLLDLRDDAHYGVPGVSDSEARRAVEWAHRMVARASEVLAT